MGKTFKEIQDMVTEPWSNDACRGYVIMAMENCGFQPKDIEKVVAELYEVFDIRAVREAENHYYNSSY
ncbi:MAG: hypothetical protein Q4F17_05845 [Eubacteriales bacterium]|nr:hypothetical protein [Eubacteriales bacterium]